MPLSSGEWYGKLTHKPKLECKHLFTAGFNRKGLWTNFSKGMLETMENEVAETGCPFSGNLYFSFPKHPWLRLFWLEWYSVYKSSSGSSLKLKSHTSDRWSEG